MKSLGKIALGHEMERKNYKNNDLIFKVSRTYNCARENAPFSGMISHCKLSGQCHFVVTSCVTVFTAFHFPKYALEMVKESKSLPLLPFYTPIAVRVIGYNMRDWMLSIWQSRNLFPEMLKLGYHKFWLSNINDSGIDVPTIELLIVQKYNKTTYCSEMLIYW